MTGVGICVEWSKKKKNRGCFMGCCCSESNDDISEADILSVMTMVDVIDTSMDLTSRFHKIPKPNPFL